MTRNTFFAAVSLLFTIPGGYTLFGQTITTYCSSAILPAGQRPNTSSLLAQGGQSNPGQAGAPIAMRTIMNQTPATRFSSAVRTARRTHHIGAPESDRALYVSAPLAIAPSQLARLTESAPRTAHALRYQHFHGRQHGLLVFAFHVRALQYGAGF